MAVDLLTLPIQLYTVILKRMNPRALCRLRQTCSIVNNFVEKKRFHNYSYLHPHCLWIQFLPKDSNDTESLKIFVLNQSIHGRYTYAVYHAATQTPAHKQIHISDPFYQLSAISFSAVVLQTNYFKMESDMSEYYRNTVISLLQKLRLRCEWLNFYDMSANDIPLFLPLMRFSNVSFTLCDDITVAHMENWPIQHCEELSIYPVGGEVPLSIENLTKRKVLFLGYVLYTDAHFVFIQFLKAISFNESAKGNLEHFRIVIHTDNAIVDEDQSLTRILPNAEFLCTFKKLTPNENELLLEVENGPGFYIDRAKLPQDKQSKLSLQLTAEVFKYDTYRLPLNNETIYIFCSKRALELHFLKENSRRNLFSTLTSFAFQEEIPLEQHLSYYNDFLKAENDATAIQEYMDKLFNLMDRMRILNELFA